MPSISSANELDRDAVADALVAAGKHYDLAGKYEEARHAFQSALVEHPQHPEAVLYLAGMELATRMRDEHILAALQEAQGKMRRSEQVSSEPDRSAEGQMSSSLERRSELVAVPTNAQREVTEHDQPQRVRGAALALKDRIPVIINGQQVEWGAPLALPEGRPLIPLQAMAVLRYAGLVQTGPNTFRLIFPDGISQETTVTRVDHEPMLTESQVRDLFDVETFFDESRRVFNITTLEASTFQTSTMPKPEEELREEALANAVTEQRKAASPELTGEVPIAAQPFVQLHGAVSYAYRHRHGQDPDRSVITSLTGRAYDFDVRGESTRKDIGGVFDHDYSYLNFSRPELYVGLFDQTTDLFPLRGQSERFNGLKVRRMWDQATATTLLGGETETTTSGPSGSVKYLGTLYQAGQDFNPMDWLRVRSSLLYLQNEADLPHQSGTTPLPRENVVAFTDLTMEPIRDLSVSGQMARATYRPDDAPDDVTGDWDWRASSVFKKARGQLGATYEFVGDRYASIGNPAVYQDFQGWNLFGHYRLTKTWLLSSNFLRYRNNVENDPRKITQENQAVFLSSSLQLPWQHTATVSWNDFIANPSGPDPGSSSRSSVYRVDYTLPFFFSSYLVTNAQHAQTRQPAASDSSSNGLGATLFKGFRGGSSVHLSQQFTESDFETSPDTLDATTSFTATYQWDRRLSVYGTATYTRQLSDEVEALDTLTGSLGLRTQLASNTTFTSEYRIDSYSLDAPRRRWPRDWSLLFLLTQGFELFSQPTFGTIEGRVGKDLNDNGRIDPEEPGVEDVTVQLDQARETLTEAQGHFGFVRVVPGRHAVRVDLGSVPPEWMLSDPEAVVEVGRSERARLFFPLIHAASIQGRVFIDENKDGRFQDVEEPLEGMAVILMPGEQFRRSDAEGVVRFDHVMPGRYALRLYREGLPMGYAPTSEEDITIELSAGEQVDELPFAVQLQSAPLRQ